MKLFTRLSILTLSIALLFSCKKYEEGPGISFRSKKERIANTWIIEKYVHSNGTEHTSTNEHFLELKKDGGVNLDDLYSGFNDEWSFESNKDRLKISVHFDNEVYNFIRLNNGSDQIGVVYFAEENSYKILRLKETELWLEDPDGGKLYLREK